MLLVETIRRTGRDQAISTALSLWRKPRTVHDPGKILLDVAPGGRAGWGLRRGVGMLRAEPAVFGPVASDSTVSRLVDALASSGPKALAVVRASRAESASAFGSWSARRLRMRAGS
ncbi:transposase [Streptomyces spiramyceticus]|uniref:transposase n=1 Tax=Streptomyces spiramyceticus TaxID=299717 RepID=UPI00237A12AD|nr:transposase [Streptomyces spiramyceticus]